MTLLRLFCSTTLLLGVLAAGRTVATSAGRTDVKGECPPGMVRCL